MLAPYGASFLTLASRPVYVRRMLRVAATVLLPLLVLVRHADGTARSTPIALAPDGSAVWVTNPDSNTVAKVDPANIAAGATDTSQYVFTLPRSGRKRDIRVHARLCYRRAFKPTADQRKWNVPLGGNPHGTRGDGTDYDENFVRNRSPASRRAAPLSPSLATEAARSTRSPSPAAAGAATVWR
jgi:hypothetical protein